MKGLKKLVLASAIAAASSSSFAMQAMDDESMSAATGQDGLTITINSVALNNLDIKYIDRDGVAGDATYNNPGAIHIVGAGGPGDGLSISSTGTTIDIDAGGNAGTGAGTGGQLRINVAMGATTVNLQNVTISVADAAATGSTIGADVAILEFGTGAALNIAAGGTAAIRLGDRTGYVAATAGTPDGDLLTDADGDGDFSNDAADGYVAATAASGNHLIEVASSLPSLTLTALSIVDAVEGGRIGVGSLALGSVNSNVGVDVVAGGLRIDTTGTTIGSIALENVQLGTVDFSNRNSAIGDVYITGAGGGSIALNNVITVTGH
ncbi:MAG: DUF6160 family protein [Moraxellaceae bacterium]